jgi:hypothetical protein
VSLPRSAGIALAVAALALPGCGGNKARTTKTERTVPLRVLAPRQGVTVRASEIELRAVTNPGAFVRATNAGTTALHPFTALQGRFAKTVSLNVGWNNITLTAHDVRHKDARVVLRIRRSRPSARALAARKAHLKARRKRLAQFSAKKPAAELTGFGASKAAWNAHHRADDRFDPGSAYDPTPSLARGDQRHNDRYYNVQAQAGKITSYEMRFPPSTGIKEAKRSILAEFPSDANIGWFKRRSSCAQMWVGSAQIERTNTIDGALVTFSSGEAGDQYDPNDVWSAILFGASYPASGLGC